MPNPETLRSIRARLEEMLALLSTSALVSEFTYTYAAPTEPCQFWEYELDVFSDDDQHLRFKCGCLMGQGTDLNPSLDLNLFFENNDRLFDEFNNSVVSGAFQALLPLMKEADSLCDGNDGGSSIMLFARVNSQDPRIRDVCEEPVLILFADEKEGVRIDIDCMQGERYLIEVPTAQGSSILKVPFDKVNRFSGAVRIEPETAQAYREYQVALSFAGEDRPYVSRVARHLREMKIRVFYDAYEEVELWGKDLYVHLDNLYQKRARYCVMFLSVHYARKLWTNHERTSAQARAFEKNKEYILPVKLDETEVPGIRQTIGYLARLTPRKLAEAIQHKLFGLPSLKP